VKRQSALPGPLAGRPIDSLPVDLAAGAVDARLVNRLGQAVSGYDLLNLEAVRGDAVHLPVKGVRLVELDE